MDYITQFTIAKDIVLSIAAAIGSYVAFRGLTNWTRQLKGGNEYELTRRLLKITYRLRDAIKGVRNPIMWRGETPFPEGDDGRLASMAMRNFYGESREYQKRWSNVAEVRADLQTELLEAEALWGQEIHDLFEPIFKLQNELFVAVDLQLTVCDPSEPLHIRNSRQNAIRKRRDVMYEITGETEDEFTTEMTCAIKSIETFLKPHLRK